MIIAESCHPGQRLAYPNSAKVLAGLTSHIVNRFMEADTVEICLAEIFGEGEVGVIYIKAHYALPITYTINMLF